MENREKSSWSTGRAVGRRKEIVEYRHPYGQLEAEERFSGELGGSRGVIVFCIMYNSPTQLGSRSLASATPASRRARYICCTGLVLYRIQPLTVTTSWIFASSSSRFFSPFFLYFPPFVPFFFLYSIFTRFSLVFRAFSLPSLRPIFLISALRCPFLRLHRSFSAVPLVNFACHKALRTAMASHAVEQCHITLIIPRPVHHSWDGHCIAITRMMISRCNGWYSWKLQTYNYRVYSSCFARFFSSLFRSSACDVTRLFYEIRKWLEGIGKRKIFKRQVLSSLRDGSREMRYSTLQSSVPENLYSVSSQIDIDTYV